MTSEFLPLKGRSKAKIEFNYKNSSVKKSNSSDGIRLNKQAEKQQLFENLNINNIKTPKIKKIGHNYFYMEFINGKNFIQFVENENINNINNQIENIIDYLKDIRNIPSVNKSDLNTAILEKLNQLNIKKHHPNIFNFISDVLNKNNLNIESTYCHGDLSLSNVIFKENKIYLIDFLDVYFSSYLLDIAKIRQDTYYYWLFNVNKYSSVKCNIVTKKINAKLESEFKHEISSLEFKIIELINFLRIEPYAYDEGEKKLLNEIIYKIFYKIRR